MIALHKIFLQILCAKFLLQIQHTVKQAGIENSEIHQLSKENCKFWFITKFSELMLTKHIK